MKLKIISSQIRYVAETENSYACFDVYINRMHRQTFYTREEAQKYIDELKQTIIIRTRGVGQYFRGVVKMSGGEWFISCNNYSGGSEIPLLDIIDYKCKTEKQLLNKLTKFKRKYKLISDLKIENV